MNSEIEFKQQARCRIKIIGCRIIKMDIGIRMAGRRITMVVCSITMVKYRIRKSRC